MKVIHWIFLIGTVGLSAGIAFYGVWVRARYARRGFSASMTGSEVARTVLDRMGMAHVSVTPIESSRRTEDQVTAEGFLLCREVYDGRDLLSLVQAARLAFLKGQMSNLVFWNHLQRKLVFAARFAVVLGWFCFLSGLFLHSFGFLVPFGLGAFLVVIMFAFFDLVFELESEERTSGLMAEANCFDPKTLECFVKLNQMMALEGLACLVRMPLEMMGAFFRRRKCDGF